ncbi:MAG: ATP-binding cassette domain-containing protein [Oligoflexia bacterium]|nr:ATP-binding cassette domain-containing protein [Oligoflexia bacterium]
MIEVKNLSKNYASIRAVDNINFTVERGEIMGFLGPNGAGKTTTMRIITGYIPPTSGTVRVYGYDVAENPSQAKKCIGYLPELPPLYPEMKVEKYIQYVGQIREVSRDKLKKSVDRAIDICGLSSVRGRLIGNLSKGYRQRVGLAQALVHDPDVLILDEPTSGLDPKQIIEIRHLIKSLAGEHTIILCTHILSEVTQTCGRVAIINEGRIVALDHHDNLSRHLKGTDGYELVIGNFNDGVINAVRGVEGVTAAQKSQSRDNTVYIEAGKEFDPRPGIIRAAVNADYDVLEFKSLKLSLEDVFLKLTADDHGGAQ